MGSLASWGLWDSCMAFLLAHFRRLERERRDMIGTIFLWPLLMILQQQQSFLILVAHMASAKAKALARRRVVICNISLCEVPSLCVLETQHFASDWLVVLELRLVQMKVEHRLYLESSGTSIKVSCVLGFIYLCYPSHLSINYFYLSQLLFLFTSLFLLIIGKLHTLLFKLIEKW